MEDRAYRSAERFAFLAAQASRSLNQKNNESALAKTTKIPDISDIPPSSSTIGSPAGAGRDPMTIQSIPTTIAVIPTDSARDRAVEEVECVHT
jgi:hypothetical protein